MHRTSDVLYTVPSSGDGPYSDPYRSLPVKMHRAREAFTTRVRAPFQAHNLTDPQWRVLRILSLVEEIDLSELADRSMLLGPSLSRILRDLEARALIARRTCGQDGRRSLASITPAGTTLIATVAPELNPIFQELRERIPADKIAVLNGLLDDVIAALSR